ncbi:MAG: hypothetical protein HY247_06495 [archaeon]|nr:MAG: hypothetical protein HY247_06495 [archaeon]
MEIWRQVFRRSARMGLGYVVLSLVMGIFLSVGLNVGAAAGNVVGPNGNLVPVGGILSGIVVPLAALIGLVITTPVYLLFVNDKNSGVLEYLLAVGMDQREIFLGYLKASVALSLVALVPVLLIHTAFMSSGLWGTLFGSGLALATGVSDVALVTVLMTTFSSMQRRPTGMNSPLGITVGVFFIMPEIFLVSLLRTAAVYLEVGVALTLLVLAVGFLLSLGRVVRREKLLP